MEITTLHSQLKQNQTQSFYIFTGTEIEAQRIYIKRIADCSNTTIVRVDSVAEAVNQMRKGSLIRKGACYVVRDDNDFIKAEKSWSSVIGMLNDNILILLYTKLDKRSVFSKHFKDIICEFAPLQTETLKKYIQKKIPLSDKNAGYLAEICENDYSRILFECDKIRWYCNETKLPADNVFRTLVVDGTIYSQPEDMVFEWVHCILNDDRERAWELFYEAKNFGSATLQMISLLYNNVKQTLQVQSYEGGNVEKATGLTAYQIKCAKQHSNVFYNSDLIELMYLLHKVEMQIKTGEIDEDIALEYVLTKFFY